MGLKEKELLELLELPTVQNKLRIICGIPYNNAQSDTSFIQKLTERDGTIRSLNEQLEQCRKELSRLSMSEQKYQRLYQDMYEKCGTLKAENSRLQNDAARNNAVLEKCRKELIETGNEIERARRSEKALSDAVEQLRARFSAPVQLLERYRSLSLSVRTGLSDIVCDKDEVLFIASCSSPENLKAIWVYTRNLAGGGSSVPEDVDTLKDIFDHFFDVFNSSRPEPVYERDRVEPGWLFDDDRYDRCSGSATSGSITEVVLRGYRSVNTGSMICRSLVRV